MSAALHDHYTAGAATHGPLALTFEAFTARIAAHAARRAARSAYGARTATEALPRLAGADLFLACACDAGVPGAWERFHALYRVRLTALARARRLPPAAATEAVDDLLQDLALPAPGGAARTLLGTYEGTGSLFGWLAAVLVRRLLRASRNRTQGLEASEHGAAEAAGEEDDPLTAVLDGETKSCFTRALEGAWARLTRNERLAIVAAHRHGLLHREIGGLLGVGRPRVTRLLAAGIRRLRDAVLPALGDDEAVSQGAWRGLCSAVETHLARMAPGGLSAPPTKEAGASGRHDHRNT